jgi:DNA-binding NtrC family response regulator
MSAEAWERALRQLVKLREGERWGRQLLQRIGGTVVFISAKSIEVLTKAAAIGGSKSSLITTVVGETGVGKGIVSRLLHQHRMSVCQASGQFVSYPCSNSASLIIENELFGVKQGAYPGAIPRQGKFELAAQGTISLNQIQNLPLETQSKLIHVIDDKKTTKIGGSEEVEFTGHLIVCTTTSPLLPVEEGGSFSTELLRRMDTSVIEVPPLRKRREDILPLAERFLDAFIDGVGEESRPKLESDAKEWLLQKSLLWPKNLGTLEKLLNISSDWGAKKRIHHTDLEKSAKEIKGFYEET